ncbi:MAG: protein kinase [Myxococcota bacterium]|nr:protein kinase [Myxococcota bacterium]
MLDGRYRIDAILGTGGMGRVYRGEHTGIGRAVAIKVLHADLNRNREAAQRFQREALASGRLDHPNIVGVSDFGVLDDGACYLVMEVLEGESLGQRLERERRIPWREAVVILRGVLQGLRHAHERGVVHRDIKPDNVFLTRRDGELTVKILDFGIAKLYAGSPDDPASTRAGLTVGTPAYLSPEQAVGGEITPASDLYSSSIVLYEMIAGRTPFADKDPLAMLGAHVSREPPPLAQHAPDVEIPPGLEEVLQYGLNKMSAERFQSALDYIAALERIVATAPVLPPRSAAVALPDPSASSGFGPDFGSMDTAAFEHTPMPVPRSAQPRLQTPTEFGDQSIIMTVTPGDPLTPMPRSYTPVPGGHRTPPPGSLPSVIVAAPTTSLDALGTQQRAVSLTDVSEPIPRRWIFIGGLVVVIGIVIAIVLALSSSKAKRAAPAPPPPTTTPPVKGVTAPPAPPPMPSPIATVDRDTQLKAALHDLQTSKTCPERKAVIARLVKLDDARAIEPLRRARYRKRGGVMGIGGSNTNACLRAEAEAAIKKLGGTLR